MLQLCKVSSIVVQLFRRSCAYENMFRRTDSQGDIHPKTLFTGCIINQSVLYSDFNSNIDLGLFM